jgi:uncharacterized protein with FMN-binding domain
VVFVTVLRMPILITLIVLVVVVVVGTHFSKDKMPVTQGTTPLPETEPAAVTVAEYADGTYTASGTYSSPAGAEHVDVSITLAGDVVTGATFTGHAENPGSVANQQKFARGYEAVVIGRNIDEIALTVVNGSSLTPTGFMEALDAIKEKARI